MQGRVVRITFSTVIGESGQEHCEVTGRMPSLNNTLQAALELESGDLVQLMTELEKICKRSQISATNLLSQPELALLDFCHKFRKEVIHTWHP